MPDPEVSAWEKPGAALTDRKTKSSRKHFVPVLKPVDERYGLVVG
jgi:hypothetical protein